LRRRRHETKTTTAVQIKVAATQSVTIIPEGQKAMEKGGFLTRNLSLVSASQICAFFFCLWAPKPSPNLVLSLGVQNFIFQFP